MVLRTASHKVSSHQTRDLADSSSIPWNRPPFFRLDLIARVPQMFLPLFYALRSQQTHWCPICAVLTNNDSRKYLHKICQILGNKQCKWLLVSSSAPRTFVSSFCVSWEVLGFTWVWLYQLCCQVLYHCSVSMTVSRFISFAENFVNRKYEITNFCRSEHDCTSAFSARNPCNFGSQADIAISVLREVSENDVLTDTTFARGSEGKSCEELEASRCSGTLSSTRLSLNSSSHSGISCDEFPRASSLSSFLFWFPVSAGPCDEFPRTSPLTLSLLVDAGYSVGVTVSCDEDVEVGEDELEELVDRPRTTICTKFAVLQSIFLPFLMRCGSWPLAQW